MKRLHYDIITGGNQMDTSMARARTRFCEFNGILEVVDCIDRSKAKVVMRKTGLRNPFMSIFPKKMLEEKGLHFYSDLSGKTIIMEIHDINILKQYLDDLEDHRYLGIYWDNIYDTVCQLHQIN